MDKKLEEIIKVSDERKKKALEASRKIQADEDKKQRKKAVGLAAKANKWVDENIFNYIEKAELKGDGGFHFSNGINGISGDYIVQAVKKIDGIKTYSQYCPSIYDPDGQSFEAEWEYYIYWRPEQMKRWGF